MTSKLPVGTLDKLWGDANSWRADLIYVCKDDPRLIVPQRKKWRGWTINFAHISAWLLLLAVMVAGALPAVLAKAGMAGTWGWLAFIIGFAVFACVLSAILSSPKWYEHPG
jgi:hypothetical protein